MWERCTELVTGRGTKVLFNSPVTRVHHDDGRATAVTAETDGVADTLRVHPRHLVDADRRARRGDGPAAARPRCSRAARATRLPRPHHGRAGRAPRPRASPTTGSTSTTPTSRWGGSRTSGRGRPYMVKDGRTCLGLEYFVNEGDDMWTKADDDLVELGKRELAAIGLARRRPGRGGLRRADAEGVPDVRRDLQGQRRRCSSPGSTSQRPQRVSRRPQRDAQVQQPGPLDVHGDALGREHLRRRTTTCGRSTSKRSTTRSAARTAEASPDPLPRPGTLHSRRPGSNVPRRSARGCGPGKTWSVGWRRWPRTSSAWPADHPADTHQPASKGHAHFPGFDGLRAIAAGRGAPAPRRVPDRVRPQPVASASSSPTATPASRSSS